MIHQPGYDQKSHPGTSNNRYRSAQSPYFSSPCAHSNVIALHKHNRYGGDDFLLRPEDDQDVLQNVES